MDELESDPQIEAGRKIPYGIGEKDRESRLGAVKDRSEEGDWKT